MRAKVCEKMVNCKGLAIVKTYLDSLVNKDWIRFDCTILGLKTGEEIGMQNACSNIVLVWYAWKRFALKLRKYSHALPTIIFKKHYVYLSVV